MILKNVIDLRKSIEKYRQKMNNMVRVKGMNDPEVINISQLLDEKIVMLQKMSSKIYSPYQHEKLSVRTWRAYSN